MEGRHQWKEIHMVPGTIGLSFWNRIIIESSLSYKRILSHFCLKSLSKFPRDIVQVFPITFLKVLAYFGGRLMSPFTKDSFIAKWRPGLQA